MPATSAGKIEFSCSEFVSVSLVSLMDALNLAQTTRPSASSAPRLSCLDALRSWMMLLGIVLHTANAHAIGCPHWWPVTDRYRHGIFDLFSFATHSFRMEVFFLLSGFFGRLLLRRYGLSGFVVNRGRRVLLPLAIGIVLMVAVQSGASWYFTAPGTAPARFPDYVCIPWPSEVVVSAVHLWHPWFCHLWFLEYLSLFYVAMVLLDVVLSGRGSRWLDSWERRLAWLIRQAWMPLAAAAVTMVALLPMRSWVVDTPLSMVPQCRFFLYYGPFVALGWMMHRNTGLLTSMARHWNRRNSIGLVLSAGVLAGLLWNVGSVPAHASWITTFAIRAVSSLCTWLALLQILGAVVVMLGKPSPMLRYLADASYWCYLVHLPIVLWLQGALPPGLTGMIRFGVVLLIATAVSLASYHLFVRYTLLNEVFGSRRPTRAATATGAEIQACQDAEPLSEAPSSAGLAANSRVMR
ncbi:MAG: acyltransferase family protein [Planctomycetaceae bacterium]|nr:acyltransferase family protein [Planctomycetaceae bacterium]